jgi:hypothetical protein
VIAAICLIAKRAVGYCCVDFDVISPLHDHYLPQFLLIVLHCFLSLIPNGHHWQALINDDDN